MGREAGITEEKLVDLEKYDSSERFSKEERLVLRLADAMVSTPARIDDGLFSDAFCPVPVGPGRESG